MDKGAVRQDLIDQLERRGVIGNHFYDLIDDYVKFWDIKNDLIADIEDRGVSVKWQNSETSWGYKKNESIGELLKTNAQMLRILRQLGIEADADPDLDDLEM